MESCWVNRGWFRKEERERVDPKPESLTERSRVS